MQTLEQDLKARQVIYNNNPLLKWCISNTRLEEDRNGNYMPKKSNNPKYKIDGLASLLDAYTGLVNHYQEYLNAI
jgi:phage terminase large subunit-like protein